jgi:hypothetical protein
LWDTTTITQSRWRSAGYVNLVTLSGMPPILLLIGNGHHHQKQENGFLGHPIGRQSEHTLFVKSKFFILT